MSSTIYLIGQFIILLLAFGMVSSIRFALRRAYSTLGWEKPRTDRRVNSVGLILWSWMAVVGLLGWLGFFRADQADFPLVFLTALPPVAVVLALLFLPAFRPVLEAIPRAWLLYGQSFRFLTDLFLWMGYLGQFVPPQMTFLWLNYDFTVGLTAPGAGWIFFAKGRFRRVEAIWWNVFGIVLLLNNLLIALFSMPSPFQVFAITPDSAFLGEFPFVWLIAFFFPLALAMHVFSLKQTLLAGPTTGRRTFSIRK